MEYLRDEQKEQKKRDEAFQTTIHKLEETKKQKVDNKDYHAQIDRWNKYQSLLDKVGRQLPRNRFGSLTNDVTLERRIKTNINRPYWFRTNKTGYMSDMGKSQVFHIFYSLAIIILGTAGAIYAGAIDDGIHTYYDSDFYIAWTLYSVALAMTIFMTYSAIRTFVYRPKMLVFECKPELHFDEVAYARRKIEGLKLPPVDPVVKLPTIKMKIPRKWMGQQSVLEFMEKLKDIKWDV